MSDADGRSIRNLIHASGSVKEAQDEIAHWFKKDELFEYTLVSEAILYGLTLDGIL
jgi:nucleoside-diphosphate kinase